jgi:hypothetical protein
VRVPDHTCRQAPAAVGQGGDGSVVVAEESIAAEYPCFSPM